MIFSSHKFSLFLSVNILVVSPIFYYLRRKIYIKMDRNPAKLMGFGVCKTPNYYSVRR